jgi:hypothetical protein
MARPRGRAWWERELEEWSEPISRVKRAGGQSGGRGDKTRARPSDTKTSGQDCSDSIQLGPNQIGHLGTTYSVIGDDGSAAKVQLSGTGTT